MPGCELLSDCIFEIGNHNLTDPKSQKGLVVNCFQIVSLK